MVGKREGSRGAFGLPCLSLTCTCCLSLSLASTHAIHITDIAVQQFPPKVDKAFKALCYIPYSVLTTVAKLRAAWGEEDFVVNAQGGLTAKGLDCRGERSLSMVEWYAATKAAAAHISIYHGKTHMVALAAHHKLVMDLGQSHGWETAMEYDVQQRELAALHLTHDLSMLDTAALTIIATCPSPAFPPQAPLTPPKHPATSDTWSAAPRKKPKATCFHYRGSGHLPGDCQADSTAAGRWAAPIATNSKSRHTLLASNGRQLCFNWARSSSCTFDNNCNNYHGCSICSNNSHSAGGCQLR